MPTDRMGTSSGLSKAMRRIGIPRAFVAHKLATRKVRSRQNDVKIQACNCPLFVFTSLRCTTRLIQFSLQLQQLSKFLGVGGQ